MAGIKTYAGSALAAAGALALAGIIDMGAALAADAPATAPVVEEATAPGIVISGGAAFTTDYVFRGISQSNSDPAVQGYIELGYDMFYIGMWGSSLDFGGTGGLALADLEVDFYAGIKPKWNSVEFDIGGIYYVYPSANDPAGGEFNYFEAKGTVSVPVHEMFSLGAGAYVSPDFFGETGWALYLEAKGSVSLPYGFGLSAALGHQWIEDNAAAGVPDYITWNIGASYTFRDTLTFDLRYHDTDVGGCGACDERIVGTISASFSTQ